MAKKKRVRPQPETLGLPCLGVDTHAHLDMDPLVQEVEQVLARSQRAGVSRVGHVFLGPKAYSANRHLFAAHDEVFFLAGTHPHDARECTEEGIAVLCRAMAEDPRLVAWGEIGLDYYYTYSPQETQQKALYQQLEAARQLDVPPVIHSRDADETTLRILVEMGFVDRPVLWHCFGRDVAFGRELIDNGWTISIPGPVSYRRNFPLQEAVRELPLERLVLETDAPFLAPEPYRGKGNEPAFTVFTAQAVAELKEIPVEQVWRATAENARAFFGLGPEAVGADGPGGQFPEQPDAPL